MANSSLDNDRQQAAAFVDQAANLPIVNLAFNQTVSSATPTEILTVASFGPRALAVFIMSPVTAKTMALSLLERVKEFEKMSGAPVKTYSEMASASANGVS